MGYKSKKKLNSENITIPKSAIRKMDNGSSFKIYSRTIHSSIKLHHEKINDINNDIKVLHAKKCNLWYLCIPIEYDIKTLTENQGCVENIVSIDPGVKSFLTLYDPNGNLIKIGKQDMDTILDMLNKKTDNLKSIKTKVIGKKKYNITKRIHSLFYKVKNYITEIYAKTCKFLTDNYQHILLPKLKATPNGSSNRRKLKEWGHCNFIDRLTYSCIDTFIPEGC